MIIAAYDVYFVHRYVSAIELGWTLLGVAGLTAAYRNARDALRDLGALAASPHRGDALMSDLAVGSLRSEGIRLLEQALIVAIGILALTQRTPRDIPNPTLSGWLFLISLYGIAGGLALNSVLDARMRKRLHALRSDESRPPPDSS